MGKGRDRRRRKRKEVVSIARIDPRGEPLGPVDPYAPVLSPIRPRPSLLSGAIALAEPEELLSEFMSVGISK